MLVKIAVSFGPFRVGEVINVGDDFLAAFGRYVVPYESRNRSRESATLLSEPGDEAGLGSGLSDAEVGEAEDPEA